MIHEDLFDSQAKARIEAAVRAAEKITGAEIRVHVDNRCTEDVLDHAAYTFAELQMHKTKLRNGILIYVTIDDRQLAVIGDAGIHAMVSPDFWQHVSNAMATEMSSGRIEDGILRGIEACANELKKHFPLQRNDVNELPNQITFGNR